LTLYPGGIWEYYYNDPLIPASVVYQKNTTTRDIPAKQAGDLDGWYATGNVVSLYIKPDANYLNPWEYRRRRLLECA
jgi:hypothetical protein